MEAVILEFPVSKEEQLALYHARQRYELLQSESGIATDFDDFFGRISKTAFSPIETAAYDAVIYHCYKTLDKLVSAVAIARLFRISSEQLLDIIWEHRKKVEGEGMYYRIFTRKLGEHQGVAVPLVLDPPASENTVITREQVSLIIDAIFQEIIEKTAVSKDEICSDSRKELPVRCRIVFANIVYAIFNNRLSLKTIGGCINRGHASVIGYKKDHRSFFEQSQKEYVRQETKEYWALYNHIASRMEKRLL